MEWGIRRATADDAEAVSAFFTSVYEVQHGAGSAVALEMLARTIAVLFPEASQPPVVWVYDSEDGDIQGAAAIREPEPGHNAELIAIQVYDTVQGKGIASTLLTRARDFAAEAGATGLFTTVEGEDHRARGFLRREGFEHFTDADGGVADGASLVTYVQRW